MASAILPTQSETLMIMQHTSEELNAFEQITFKNMVTFYREELQRVLNGEKSTQIFSKGDRRVLRRLGVLKLRPTGHYGRVLEVSPRTKKLLKTWRE
jgi:hypothetical protein